MASNSPQRKKQRLHKNLESESTTSKDSLHYLNDDCLWHIFKLLDMESLCNMSDSCTRFDKIAKQVFPRRYESVEFELGSYKRSTFRRVLCKFGSMIKSISTQNFVHSGEDNYTVNSIVKYCTEPLEQLALYSLSIDCDKAKTMISDLKVLELSCCKFTGNSKNLLANCSKLERFYFDSVEDASCTVHKFPQLNTLVYDGREWMSLCRLLDLNPQIKTLHVMCYPDDNLISIIVERVKDLESLTITPGFMCRRPYEQTARGLLQLCKLKSLKRLILDAGDDSYSKFAMRLLNALCKKKMPLECLDLNDFSIKAKEIKSIGNIKTLKTIHLHDIKAANVDNLTTLINELPLLVEVHMQFDYDAPVKIVAVDLEKLVFGASKLTYLGVSKVRNFKINQTIYESLLAVVRSRDEKLKLTIRICGCKSTNGFDVSQDDRREKEILEIEFEGWECDCGACDDE